VVKEKGYAKINLFLNVVGKRLDGYHELEMVMAPLRLHDVLTFTKNSTGEISVSSNKKIVENEKDNIVYKVAEFLQEEFSVVNGVDITIEKNIPLAGGLAGGSADAAATLRGLNKLWKLNLSLNDLAKLGLEFGADIPFCVYNKMAIAKGVGEDLSFFKKKLKEKVLIVNPNIEISTKKVFGLIDKPYLVDKPISKIVEVIKNRDFIGIKREMYNHLEHITFKMHPELRVLKNELIDLGLEATLMSGSGASIYSLSNNGKKIMNLSTKIDKNYYVALTKFL